MKWITLCLVLCFLACRLFFTVLACMVFVVVAATLLNDFDNRSALLNSKLLSILSLTMPVNRALPVSSNIRMCLLC